ncbi:hypothetical protein [Geomesophilobacter sediminis]|uniref:Uncharacterized protein n=1 Tax=Geomesophilobacter sediminis TaxID=2798584 RepID=A0A8J7M0U7_9BACT|nr:hypothetical protein [Geomesophilobacter sediminis]MBJ6726545.1 hypothetical protein [Geomesophilobacter sediminis]
MEIPVFNLEVSVFNVEMGITSAMMGIFHLKMPQVQPDDTCLLPKQSRAPSRSCVWYWYKCGITDVTTPLFQQDMDVIRQGYVHVSVDDVRRQQDHAHRQGEDAHHRLEVCGSSSLVIR